MAFTRGAWIGGAVGVVLVGIVAWRHRVRMRRLDWIPAGVSAALGVGIIWRSLSNPNEVMNFGKRLASIFEFGSGSGQTRTEIWQAGFAAIKEQPILGWGADTFRLVFPRFKPVEYVRDAGGGSVADNAHNYPLQLASGVGIPGMVMMYGIFVWAGVRSFKTVFGRSCDPAADRARRLLGGGGRIPRAASRRPVAHRHHVPAVGVAGRRTGPDGEGAGSEGPALGDRRGRCSCWRWLRWASGTRCCRSGRQRVPLSRAARLRRRRRAGRSSSTPLSASTGPRWGSPTPWR